MKGLIILLSVVFSCFLFSCKSDYTPKPRGFHRIEFPEKKYQKYDRDCPFTFDIPVYSEITPDTDNNEHPCWLNLNYLPFNATLHLSYKKLNSSKSLDTLIEDSRTLVFKHSIKAEEIEEKEINQGNRVYGMFYELSGNTATALQFFVTDSNKHYLRGALYFNTKTNIDSIAPVLSFIRKDVLELIETMRWKD